MKRTAIGIVLVLTIGVAFGAPLKIVNVSAPAINCKFDTDCKITVQDSGVDITLAGTTGKGRLQSRLFPVGEAGTAAAGLYPYEYRINLTNLVGTSPKACVTEFTIKFGPVKSVDYDGDGSLDQVYVVTQGGLGSAGPISADQSMGTITFKFQSHPCSGSAAGNGETSYFFGLTSAQAPTEVTATLKTSAGTVSLKAKAPLPAPPPQGSLQKGSPKPSGPKPVAPMQ